MTTTLALLILSPALCCSAPPEGVRAGAARADITPPVGHPMWGYGGRRDLPSTGVDDPLQARTLVIESAGRRIALVSLDLGRPPARRSYETIRDRARKEQGIDQLFLVASHTHHGPVLEVDTWPTPGTSYVRDLEKRLGDLIARGVADLRPARLAVGSREVAMNRNRHSKREDRPADRELLVLSATTPEGKPIATAVNYAAHPTIRPASSRRISADYPGPLAALVEKETGAPCLFLQGASGDLSPDRTDRETAQGYGERLGREALALARKARPLAPAAESLVTREEEFRFACRVDLTNPLMIAGLSLAFFPELVAAFEREYRDGVRPRLSLALLGGSVGFAGYSGEPFTAHGLGLKRRARLEHLFVLGLCNDYQQYFPTIEAAAEGGYGTETYISPAALGAGEEMTDRAVLRLYQMRGKLRDAGGAKPLPARPLPAGR